MKKTAVILGSTGLTGSHLLNLLLDGEAYGKVISFVRKQTGISHPKLKEHVVDFDRLDTFKDLVQGDDLFCCLGTTIKKAGSQEAFKKVDLIYPITFARLAKANGIKHYLLISSMGANPNSKTFYLKVKGECEEQLKQFQFESTSIFEPSLLLGKRQEFRLGEWISQHLMKFFSFLMVGKLRKYRAIESSDVAKAMYTVAQRREKGAQVIKLDEILKYTK